MPDAVFGALLYPSPDASCYKDASFEIVKVSNIAEAMTKLLTNDELRQQRRENVRQLATRYDYRKIYDEAFRSAYSNCKL
jgi:phosphopantothenate synthetase